MNHALEPWYRKHSCKEGKNYMDNIGIGTKLKDLDKHIEIIHDLFDIMKEHGLHLKLSKSVTAGISFFSDINLRGNIMTC